MKSTMLSTLRRSARPVYSSLRCFSEAAADGVEAGRTPLEELTIGFLAESQKEENRVSGSPTSVANFVKQGYNVLVQSGAGERSNFSDADFKDAGATVVSEADVFAKSNIICRVNCFDDAQIKKLKPDQITVSTVRPGLNPKTVELMTKQGATNFALDMVPRISRSQSMDILSSQANIAGYKAVIEAASEFTRFMSGQITAAGKV